jgi:hypothetical protein
MVAGLELTDISHLQEMIGELEASTQSAVAFRKQPSNLRSELRLASSEQASCIWVDDKGERYCQRVRVVNHSNMGLGLLSPRALKPGQAVWVATDSGTFFQGVARFCKPSGSGYRAGLQRVRGEQRRSDREPVSGTGTLTWDNSSVSVLIRNMTPEGLQLEVATKVPVSTVARLSSREVECLVVTRYSRQVEGHHQVGIEFLRPPYSKHSGEYKED